MTKPWPLVKSSGSRAQASPPTRGGFVMSGISRSSSAVAPRLSPDRFSDPSSVEGPSDVNAFLALMHAAMALEVRRAGIAATMSPGTRVNPVELLSLWLDAQALGHLALLAYRQDAPWFTEMVLELRPENWTPTL